MFPAYTWTNSYPHYALNDNPKAEPYQPWSYGGYYSYPAPPDCHGYWNHNYFGSLYGFRPPYPHYPPPPPFYPPCPGTYPAYSVPPALYTLEKPQYEYGKITPQDHHCCGCPSQSGKHESNTNVRVERKEPEVDKWRNYPYPIVWVPPGYMKNTEPEATEKEKYPHDHEITKPLESSKQGGNVKGAEDRKSGDGYNLPFPIFWLPSKNNEVEKDPKENNIGLVASNESRRSEENSGREADSNRKINKNTVQKVIPVKQIAPEEEEKSPKVTETKTKGPVENSVEQGKPLGNSGKKETSSTKASKLPPVCLRIDPLPRKKNGSGKSRSPSPPTNKARSNESATDDAKSAPESLKKVKDEEQSKSNVKTIEVVDGDTNKDKNVNVEKVQSQIQNQSHVSRRENASSEPKDQECVKVNERKKGKEEINDVNEAERKKLTENEVALIIQSAYRGFEVRKSQPLMKLRQIAEVGKQAAEVRNRVCKLEASAQIDDKQKVIIGETIMSLLLKLDTIQGLHPTVRDIRKSVARDLLGLQEKLDSLAFQKAEALTEETTSSSKPCNMNSEDKSMESQLSDGELNYNQPLTSVDPEQGIELPPLIAEEKSASEALSEESSSSTEPHNMVSEDNSMKSQQGDQPPTSVEPEQGIELPPLLIPEEKSTSEASNSSSESRGMDYEDDVMKNQQDDTELNQDQPPMSVELEQGIELPPSEETSAALAEAKKAIDMNETKSAKGPNDGIEAVVDPNQIQPQCEVGGLEKQSDPVEKAVDMNETMESEKGPDGGTEVVADYNQIEPQREVESKGEQENNPVEEVKVKRQLVEAQAVHESCTDGEVAIEGSKLEPEADREDLPTEAAPSSGGVSTDAADRKLMEENKRLQEVLEGLIRKGNKQLAAISKLSWKVKDLEKKLSRKKKMKTRKCRSYGFGHQDLSMTCQV